MNQQDHAVRLARRIRDEKQRLLATLDDPRRTQELVLADVLTRNGDTAFGTEHGLSAVAGVDDYRRAVPIRTHEALMPWIERSIAGERRVLTADQPVAYFSSSGTTGREKFIPVTPTYLRTTFLAFYYAGFAGVLDRHPELIGAEEKVLNLWQDPTTRISQTFGGQPHIGLSQLDYRTYGEPLATGPGTGGGWTEVLDSYPDGGPWERAYLRLRLAVERDVRWIIAVNPAIVAALPYQLAQWWPRMAAELHAGTLGGRPYGEPNPARALELRQVAERRGTLRPVDLWPNLRVILSWNTALASLYLPPLREAFGADTIVLSPPIASCEGPVAIPLGADPASGPLFLPGCFYEFVPADRDIEPDGDTLLADELEKGRDYHIVLTHVGGLYRCATLDIVRVVGFAGRTPEVAYAGRGTISSGSGERLREPDLIRALGAALTEVGLEIRNATARRTGSSPARYEVALALVATPPSDVVAALAEALERRLAEQSPGYRRARASGGLGAVRLTVTHPDAFLVEWERRVRAGERPPRVKDRVFQPDPNVWDRITTNAPTIVGSQR